MAILDLSEVAILLIDFSFQEIMLQQTVLFFIGRLTVRKSSQLVSLKRNARLLRKRRRARNRKRALAQLREKFLRLKRRGCSRIMINRDLERVVARTKSKAAVIGIYDMFDAIFQPRYPVYRLSRDSDY